MTNNLRATASSALCSKNAPKTYFWSSFLLLFIIYFIFPIDGMAQSNGKPQNKLPKDVQTFLKNHDLCYHFLGEEPYDAQRREYLNQQVEKYCPDIKKNLIQLKMKYKSNQQVFKTLDSYDESVE